MYNAGTNKTAGTRDQYSFVLVDNMFFLHEAG
jgi:hypothetical protein